MQKLTVLEKMGATELKITHFFEKETITSIGHVIRGNIMCKSAGK